MQDKTQTVRQKIEQPEHKKSDRQPGMETSQSDSGARGMQVRVRTGQPEPSKVRESALNEAPFGRAGGGSAARWSRGGDWWEMVGTFQGFGGDGTLV